MNDINDAVLADDPVGAAEARSRTYALLAQGFRYPEEQAFQQIADGSFAEALTEAVELCAPELADAAEKLAVDGSCQEFQSAFISAFETNMPQPSVSLYEGHYAYRENRPGLLVEIKGFYTNFGLCMAATENDLEDALTAELEFMQFLTAKEAQAVDEMSDASAYLRAQRDFLERHLALWLPALQSDVAAKIKEPFFVEVAALAAAFVAHDLAQVSGEIGRLDS